MTRFHGAETGLDSSREGFALVTTVLVVLVLSVLAVGAAWIASTEKKTSFVEGVHVSSLFSADAGGESAINFIRRSETPPQILDFADSTVRNQNDTAIQGSQTFDYDADWAGWEPKLGWNAEYYRDFNYDISAIGTASREGQSGIELRVTRLYKMGY